MPEEAAPPIEETAQEQPETPVEETSPVIDWESDDNPYRKRYEDIRPVFDRTNQEVAQYKQLVEAAKSEDPEVRNDALRQLGYEVAEEEDDDVDDFSRLANEVAQLKNTLTQREQAEVQRQQQEAEVSYLDEQFSKLEKAEDRDFSDEAVSAIAALANSIRDDQGRPDVAAAYKHLLGVTQEEAKRQRKAKRSPQVHSGTPGQKQPDLSNKDERVKYGAAIMASNQE